MNKLINQTEKMWINIKSILCTVLVISVCIVIAINMLWIIPLILIAVLVCILFKLFEALNTPD